MEDFFIGEARLWKVKHPQYNMVHEVNSPWSIVDAIPWLQIECVEADDTRSKAVADVRVL